MKYQYTIIYVDDVEKTLEFYQRAFGFELKFLHEGKDYGELKTGDCILAFANHKLGEMNLQGKYTKSNDILRTDPTVCPQGFFVGGLTATAPSSKALL